VIELDDVFVLYRGVGHDVAALRGLDLRVGDGERVVVRGPSGSGKSSLVRLVIGDVTPSAGRAVVLGTDIGTLDGAAVASWRRSSVGVVTQDIGRRLAPELTCLENIALAARLAGATAADARDRGRELLDRMGLSALASASPARLSGGEAQRVAVAAAVCHHPGLIVADEPTGELDAVTASRVYDLLVELAHDLPATLLVVSHDPAADRIADRVLTIRDGRLGEEHRPASDETWLVVDSRGWVRLPEAARRAVGITGRVSAEARPDGIVLDVVGAPDRSIDEAVGSIPPSDVGAVAVATTEVTRTIDGTTVLSRTSLTSRIGELTVIAGRSGSGKTSLLSVLAGLARPTAGSVDRPTELVQALAPRDPGFADAASVRANVLLARTARHLDGPGRCDELLAALGLTALADRPAGTLSGGERQRAAIARALVTEAPLVVLDEPTSQLDQALARVVGSLLRAEARRGRAVVCATHDPEVLACADQVIALSAVL
jgi:ABC-type lipoprotein export system ATPase subunit